MIKIIPSTVRVHLMSWIEFIGETEVGDLDIHLTVKK